MFKLQPTNESKNENKQQVQQWVDSPMGQEKIYYIMHHCVIFCAMLGLGPSFASIQHAHMLY